MIELDCLCISRRATTCGREKPQEWRQEKYNKAGCTGGYAWMRDEAGGKYCGDGWFKRGQGEKMKEDETTVHIRTLGEGGEGGGQIIMKSRKRLLENTQPQLRDEFRVRQWRTGDVQATRTRLILRAEEGRYAAGIQ